MPGETSSFSNLPFLTVIKGTLMQRADEGTPGAKLRKYELKDGTKGEKWEIPYRAWSGIVRDLRFHTTDFGEMLNVEFDDAILSLNTDSKYFGEFVKKFASADPQKEITIAPYDFETDDGKKKTGMNVVQDGEKLYDKFTTYNKETREWSYAEGFPQPEGDEVTGDDWKVYFIKVKKYLKKWVEENPINTIGDKTGDNEEIDLSKIPF